MVLFSLVSLDFPFPNFLNFHRFWSNMDQRKGPQRFSL
jgi:hypothetical protein